MMRKTLLFTLALALLTTCAQAKNLALTTPAALSPEDVQTLLQNAQAQAKGLAAHDEPSTDLFVAVSLSMPKASLIKLASDAAAAGIPLLFQGVGKTPVRTPKGSQTPTVLETYGKHWLARHLDAFAFLVETGATVQIDPTRFIEARITDVPQVVIMQKDKACQNTFPKDASCSKPLVLARARGDVTLAYALRHLMKTHDDAQIQAAVQAPLARLGERF